MLRSATPGRISALLIAAGVMLVCLADAHGGAPDWVQGAMRVNLPAAEKAVDLLRHTTVEFDRRGRVTRRERRVIRIDTEAGESRAVASVLYRKPGRTVKSLRAWLVTPNGSTKTYGMKDAADLAYLEEKVYSETRLLVLGAIQDAKPGAVFAYESVVTYDALHSQLEVWMQEDLAVALSELVVEVPRDWQVEGRWLNYDGPQPTLDGSTYRWTVGRIREVENEVAGLPVSSLSPRLAITVRADDSSKLAGLDSWEGVSTWLESLMGPSRVVDADVRRRVSGLVAEAPTRLDSVRRVAEFVQRIRYASIDLGLEKGGGYIPTAPANVLKLGYGDCKDKSNLMSCMLDVLGVESRLVAVKSDDPDYVRAEWPSPEQFNHCIVAIAVDSTQSVDAAVTTSDGHWVFFDPTDERVPLGTLPGPEWGTLALIVRESGGELVRLPKADPAFNSRTRLASLYVTRRGELEGSVREQLRGDLAAVIYYASHALGQEALAQSVSRRMARSSPNATVRDFVVSWGADGASVEMQYRLMVPVRSEHAATGLAFVAPSLDRISDLFPEIELPRHQPIRVTPMDIRDTVVVRFPAGLELDEVPERLDIETQFASYRTSFEFDGDVVQFVRTVRVSHSRVPAKQADAFQSMVRDIAAHESQPVVFATSK